MTRKKWADVQKAYLDKMSPEGRAHYEVMKQDYIAELAAYTLARPQVAEELKLRVERGQDGDLLDQAAHEMDGEVWDFIQRGQQAQAAADQVIEAAQAAVSEITEIQGHVTELGFDVTVKALLAMDGMTKGETELRADLESGLPTCGECDLRVIWSHGRFMHRLDGKTVWPLDDDTGHEPSMRDDYVSPWKNGDPQ